MKAEIFELIKSSVQLSEDLYMGADETECNSRYETLSRLSESISNSDAPMLNTIEQITAAYNSSNFAIYTCINIVSLNSTNQMYASGDHIFHEYIENFKSKSFADQMVHEVILEVQGKKFPLYILAIRTDTTTITSYTIAPSPFFTTDAHIKFTKQMCRLIQKMQGLPDDYFVLNKNLINFLEQQTSEEFLFYYNFKDLYKIFSHLGIDAVEKISEYLYQRLEKKYLERKFIYQLSLEQILIFFSVEQEDMRINFDFKSIPIPYRMKRLLIKGNSKYEKLIEYLSAE